MARLRFLDPADPRLIGTVDAIGRELSHEGWLYRYRQDDGFGKPSVAFVICSFWMVEALTVLGRRQEALAMMENIQAKLSPLGLISEDYDPTTGVMWGNFPQAYSHVGMIHAAFAASPDWSDVL
jgi:GH15 family glucan-1,4-alpha-glucosidase